MPNHVKNRLQLVGTIEQVEKVVSRFSTEYPAKLHRAYDGGIVCKQASEKYSCGWLNEQTGVFSRRGEPDAIGVPDGFEISIDQAWVQFPDFDKVIPPPETMFRGDLGNKDKERCAREGIPTWYDWCPGNWGTKWNAYSCERKSFCVFEFETAWSGVPKIIQAMSAEFPEVEFLYWYADEDTGHNCGFGMVKAGDLGGIRILQNGSPSAYELAFLLRPDRKENYRLNSDGQYEYIDED